MAEETKLCKHCQTEIPMKAKVCPNCRKKQGSKVWLIVVIAIVVLLIIGLAGGGNETSNTSSELSTKTTTVEKSSSTSSTTEFVEVASNEEPEVEEKIPQEYKNALKKAESYVTTMHMSKAAVYDQLTSEYGEGFPAEAAQYAVDNLDVDYKIQALEKGKSYYVDMSMSKDAVYNQLISEYGEQFTEEEAQYAIEHLDD